MIAAIVDSATVVDGQTPNWPPINSDNNDFTPATLHVLGEEEEEVNVSLLLFGGTFAGGVSVLFPAGQDADEAGTVQGSVEVAERYILDEAEERRNVAGLLARRLQTEGVDLLLVNDSAEAARQAAHSSLIAHGALSVVEALCRPPG